MKTISLFKSAATAAVLAVVTSTSAFALPMPSNAVTTELGALAATGGVLKDMYFAGSDGHNFNFSRSSSLGGVVLNRGIDPLSQALNVRLSDAKPFNGADFGLLTVGAQTSASTGNVSRFIGAVQAPPDTESRTFVMLLAGLGVMGAIALRRKV